MKQRKTIEQIIAEAAGRFPELTTVEDDTPMYYGIDHFGEMMADISDDYLRMVYKVMKPDYLMKDYIERRLGLPRVSMKEVRFYNK